MATSADKADKDDDEKDDRTEGDDVEEKAEEKAEAKPADKKAAIQKAADKKPAAKAEDDDDDDDDDEDEEEEAKAKPAASKPAASKPAAKTAAKPGAKPAVPAKAGAKPGLKRMKPVTPVAAPKGSFGKSLILFVVVFGGLAAAFAFLGREDNTAPAKPKWAQGQVVDVEITLVKNDQKELSCASADEIGGKHCQFEAQNKPWSKGDNTDDKKLLKPYTTTDRIQFAAAGVWSEPALAPDKIPAMRFSLKCKFKVEGQLKKIDVRWDSAGPWYSNADWYAGAVSDCKVAP